MILYAFLNWVNYAFRFNTTIKYSIKNAGNRKIDKKERQKNARISRWRRRICRWRGN